MITPLLWSSKGKLRVLFHPVQVLDADQFVLQVIHAVVVQATFCHARKVLLVLDWNKIINLGHQVSLAASAAPLDKRMQRLPHFVRDGNAH